MQPVLINVSRDLGQHSRRRRKKRTRETCRKVLRPIANEDKGRQTHRVGFLIRTESEGHLSSSRHCAHRITGSAVRGWQRAITLTSEGRLTATICKCDSVGMLYRDRQGPRQCHATAVLPVADSDFDREPVLSSALIVPSVRLARDELSTSRWCSLYRYTKRWSVPSPSTYAGCHTPRCDTRTWSARSTCISFFGTAGCTRTYG